jgi:hypothetical protein
VREQDQNDRIEEILKGSFDLHVHAGPDTYQERRLDALDTARYAHEAEMAGFALKSHYYPTAPMAQALNRVYPGLKVAGTIVLNKEVGGLNPDAVQAAADLGARVVWMPTLSADFYMRKQGKGPGIGILNGGGDLLPEVQEVLDIVAAYDMALASSHISPQEALMLFSAARDRGIDRLIATHPMGIASTDEMRQMASLGAYIEYTFVSCMPSINSTTPGGMAASIEAIGPERCLVTTDFGQWLNPPPAEGMRMAIAALLDLGMEPDAVSTLVKSNPLQLAGID